MPIYRFTCNKCQNEFEVNRSVADLKAGRIVCPACGGGDLRRIYGTFGVSMKCNPPTCPHSTDLGCGGCCHGHD